MYADFEIDIAFIFKIKKKLFISLNKIELITR